MDVISTDKNEIKLYYNSENSIGKQTNAYVQSSEKKVLATDISKTKVTGTQWVELAKNLGVEVADLVDKEHPNFTDTYDSDTDLETNDWLKLIDKHPEVITHPILIIGNRFVQIETYSDFVKYMESDSKGIEKPYKKDRQ